MDIDVCVKRRTRLCCFERMDSSFLGEGAEAVGGSQPVAWDWKTLSPKEPAGLLSSLWIPAVPRQEKNRQRQQTISDPRKDATEFQDIKRTKKSARNLLSITAQHSPHQPLHITTTTVIIPITPTAIVMRKNQHRRHLHDISLLDGRGREDTSTLWRAEFEIEGWIAL